MADSFALSNGVNMPAIGFGTWKISPDSAAEETVLEALKAGYRHIDTAKLYSNERGVGAAVRASNIPREDIFVTTKLWNSDHAYDDALHAFDESLERLGLDYVDLYLIHWPGTSRRGEAWRALQHIYKAGKAKSIGVSNYSIENIEEIVQSGGMLPMANQIEFHPFIYAEQKELLEYCKQQGIQVEAYSPLAQHSQHAHPVVIEIAKRHGRSPSQVILRWCLQHGTAPLPRSTNPDHIRENIEVLDFELSAEDMERIDHISV